MQQSLRDHLCPADKQVLLGNGTCGGIDTQKKYNPTLIDPQKLASYRAQYGINENDFVIGYTCISLCRPNIGVPHHLGDTLYRYIRWNKESSETMSALVVGQVILFAYDYT